MKSLIASGLLTVTATVGAVVASPSAATAAAPSCSHTLELYQSRYEVSAYEYINCSGVSTYDWISPRVRFTTPVHRGNGDQHCTYARSCTGAVTVANGAGSATYCATADGAWVFNESTGFPQRLSPISKCTVA